MVREAARVFARPLLKHLEPLRVVDFTTPRPPANVRQQIQAGIGCGVGEPIRRWRVKAHGIDPGFAHAREIVTDLGAVGERFAVLVGSKGAVSHAFDPEAAAADRQEAAMDLRTNGG